jgi:hypothetical protein
MTAGDRKAQLEALLDILGRERECAKQLDMAGLQQLVEQKSALLADLDLQREDAQEYSDLLRRINNENRRNAHLHRSGLNYFRGLMGAFGKATTAQVYTRAGASQVQGQGGSLLSGRV